ncbi:hypothetical protein RNJ44_03829 [Nakaseomyces bracarensis]|uniref:ERCC4 domain-containing protein n=1 Tax=Nakaseomyces bracarensis TaxID=273131 RepID=A0ABR4NY45_9SACH
MTATPIIEIIDDSSIIDDTEIEIIAQEQKNDNVTETSPSIEKNNPDVSLEISVPFIDDASVSQPTLAHHFSNSNYSEIIISSQSHQDLNRDTNNLKNSYSASQPTSSSKRILDDIISDDLSFSTDDFSIDLSNKKAKKSNICSPTKKQEAIEQDSQETINDNISSSPGRQIRAVTTTENLEYRSKRSLVVSPSKTVKSSSVRPISKENSSTEVNKQLFISESSDTDMQVSTQSNNSGTNDVNNFIDHSETLSRESQPTRPSDEENEYQRLIHYIINTKKYSNEESKELFDINLKTKKLQFKTVNQTPRDNFKARESMILELSPTLLEFFNSEVPNIAEILAPAKIQKSRHDTHSMIRFFRKCDSVYDYAHDYYFPSDLRIIEENVSIFYHSAKDFFKQYKIDKRKLFDSFNDLQIKGHNIILVLHDLNAFKRELDKIEDSKYRSRVQSQINNSNETSRSNTRQSTQQFDYGMKRFDIEQRLRYIDREWNVKVHTVNSHMEFLTSLTNLTSLIGKKRTDPAIRFMKYAHLNVKSANNRKDTLKRIFQEIGRVPEAKANSISEAYPQFQSLFHDFKIGSLKAGLDGSHLMTEKLEARLYKLFTSTDPDEGLD